jgi:hypothetical protein
MEYFETLPSSWVTLISKRNFIIEITETISGDGGHIIMYRIAEN